MYKPPKILNENFYTDNLIDDYKKYIYGEEYVENNLDILEKKIFFLEKKNKFNNRYCSYYVPFESNVKCNIDENILKNNEKLESNNVDVNEWINLKIDCEIKKKKMEEQQIKKIEKIYEKELIIFLKNKIVI